MAARARQRKRKPKKQLGKKYTPDNLVRRPLVLPPVQRIKS